MHREPRPRDIVRVPGSTEPEIVIELTGHTLSLMSVDGERARDDCPRPLDASIRLVGVASPRSHGRRAVTRAPEAAPVVVPEVSPPEVPAPAVRGSYGSGDVAPADLY